MKRILSKVPKNTLPYSCGERYMTCDVIITNDNHYRIKHCIDFFKDKETAVKFANENNIYIPSTIDKMQFIEWN